METVLTKRDTLLIEGLKQMDEKKFKNTQVFSTIFGWVFILISWIGFALMAYKGLIGNIVSEAEYAQIFSMSLLAISLGVGSLTICRFRKILKHIIDNTEMKKA